MRLLDRLTSIAVLSAALGMLSACGTSPIPTDSNSGGVGQVPTDGASGEGQIDDSVSDVIGGGGSNSPGASTIVSARIRNERESFADVTLRFIRDDVVVHLAFVRVLPDTVTAVISPREADQLDVSGVDSSGVSLAAKTLLFGRDFTQTVPAEYVIADAVVTPPDVPPSDGGSNDIPGDSPSDPPPVDSGDGETPVDVDVTEPSIVLLEPAIDVDVPLGMTFTVRWDDRVSSSEAMVTLALRRVDGPSADSSVSLGPAIAAGLDGLNDQLRAIAQGMDPGVYQVLANINDGRFTAAAVAPGLVRILPSPTNQPPSLRIVAPTVLVELHDGDALTIGWDDADADDNATVTFVLEPAESSDLAVGTFPIGPPVAENPDGVGADQMAVTIHDVLPGEYDVVGTIDDGELLGTARMAQVVRVLPAPQNDSPQLMMLEPAGDLELEADSSLWVKWSDSDANDDARISILLDPDLDAPAPTGNEILLASALSEDPDGNADTIVVGIPDGVPAATYRVLGLITDGLSQLVVAAPGLVTVVESEPAEDPGNDDPLPLPSLALLGSPDPLRTRVGLDVPFHLQATNVPASASVRLFLSNHRRGGVLRVEVTPPDLGAAFVTDTVDFVGAYMIPTDGSLPNGAWPRGFDLEVEAVVEDTTYSAVALAPVWVRQEVEVLSAQMINYWCTPSGGSTTPDEPFAGLEVVWRGGGFGDDLDVLNPVRLWLSQDGAIPANGHENDTHRLFDHSTVEGPNQVRLTRVTVPNAFGMYYDRVGALLIMRMALLPGAYHVVPEVQDEVYGTISSAAFPDPVDVCFPLPNAGFELPP